MKQRLERLARLAQQTQPPESAAVDLRVFEYGVGSVWPGHFDHDLAMESLAVLPEPTPADEEVSQNGK